MKFRSLLFPQNIPSLKQKLPSFLCDLNLDQVIGSLAIGREEYDLAPFFYEPLHDRDTIIYRQEIFRDLETRDLFELVKAFSRELRRMREELAFGESAHYEKQKQWWFLAAICIYCKALENFAEELSSATVRSSGFLALREYLNSLLESSDFVQMSGRAIKLREDLLSLRYIITLKNGNTVQVRRYESEEDYSAEIVRAFGKFKQGDVKKFIVDYQEDRWMNHVGEAIVDMVARLYPSGFGELDEFCRDFSRFIDGGIELFDREIQFYLSFLDYIAPFKEEGLPFCYPCFSVVKKEIFSREGFDLALAEKLISKGRPIVCNDFTLSGEERIIVVSGPNQGGKTTFARAFGQLHFLGALGCPVPGRSARLYLFDRIFTHFEKSENIENLRGKLHDDLSRMRAIFRSATGDSIVIMNEIFNSTSLGDEIFLSRRMLEELCRLDALGICVTFIDELASLNEKTVSMVSTVVPDDPATRTFMIVRKPAEGLAYAMVLAKKHRLNADSLRERIMP